MERDFVERVLEETLGAVLVLDKELRIVLVSPGARAILGSVPLGERAPAVLCGSGDERPVAEALSRGESAVTEIMRTTPSGERKVEVRAAPISDGGALVFVSLAAEGDGEANFAHGMWFRDEAMHQLLERIRRVAPSDASVLVRGETGSGKELVARALHLESERAEGPFVALNCAAFPAQLLESELFGHVRGSFTGAVRDHEGHFRAASGGTLFLDEVAELPLALQAKLLRVLQERRVVPVGGIDAIPIDVRVVSATNRSLRQEVEEGRFRADLMYRLRVIPLYLPPLRARGDDVVLLAQRIVQEQNERSARRQVLRMSPGALRLIRDYEWPGNIRELQNAIEYAFLLGDGPVLTEEELPPDLQERASRLFPVERDDPEGTEVPQEARRLRRALERAGGSRQLAAASLGMSRATLWRKMKAFGLDD